MPLRRTLLIATFVSSWNLVCSLTSPFIFVRSMHIHGGAKVRPFLCPVAQPAVEHYVFTLYVTCQYRLARRAIRAGRRPACCSCGRVHSCANMNSPAGGRIHSREKKWNSPQGGQVHYTNATAASPTALLAVPNVTAHPSTANVPITVLLYNGQLLCGFNVPTSN